MRTHGDGVLKSDQYVTVKNTGKVPVTLTGWSIKTKDGVVLRLGTYALEPGKPSTCTLAPGRRSGDGDGSGSRLDVVLRIDLTGPYY